MEEKKTTKNLDEAIFSLVDSVSPRVGKLILQQYQKIPCVVRDALGDFYTELPKVLDMGSIDTIKRPLKNLQKACEANPDYMEIYDAAKKEAKNNVADVVASEGFALFDTF